MKKINIVKKNTDFTRIIQNQKAYKFKDYIIFLENNTNQLYHFGISVSKKVGNAVTRNKIKRRIKSILDQFYYKNNFNCIIIVKKSVLKSSYSDMKSDFERILKKLNILKENQNEEKK